MLANAYQWLDAIMERLFAPETRRIDRMIESLTERNSRAKGKTTYGFIHLGTVYISESNKPLYRAFHGKNKNNPVPALSLELAREASTFVNDVTKVNNDKDRIRQVLYKLIYQANSKQEIRDALPECVVQIMDGWKDMPRTMNDCAWLIRNDWRSVRDYEKMLPKIEFYAMTALIY